MKGGAVRDERSPEKEAILAIVPLRLVVLQSLRSETKDGRFEETGPTTLLRSRYALQERAESASTRGNGDWGRLDGPRPGARRESQRQTCCVGQEVD